MRSILLAVALFQLLFIGCSSTYRVNNFYSKEEFYNDFNNSVKSKEVKVTLINDSSFTASEGAIIKDSTLISYVKVKEKNNMFLALSDLREINFENKDIKTASVLLKNGEVLRAENVKFGRDSIKFVGIKNIIKIDSIPIDKVKTVSYNNVWKSISSFAMIGFVCTPVAGYLIGKTITQQAGGHPENRESQELTGFLIGIPAGILTGLITGAVFGPMVGYKVSYQFTSQP
ncbi:MAG: hypothetical protein WCS69_15650 [Ignavibacteriaceae bacterium]|jgi:hypothetical protein